MQKIYKHFNLHILLIATLFLVSGYQLFARNQNSKDFAIMMYATVNADAPSITLHWEAKPDAKQFTISRKLKSDAKWIDIATLDSGITSYTDATVQLGIGYEYQILGYSFMPKDDNQFMPYVSTGYVYAGIEVPPPELGTVLLLIEQELSSEIGSKIYRLRDDLIEEGWDVVIRYTPRTEEFNGKAVKDVKNIILEEYNKNPNNLTTVLLLGRIAVPYSGNFSENGTYPPDGHVPGHDGAWPADVYYGIMNESYFTDSYVNNTAGHEQNHNIVGDGKFDETVYQYETVNLRIGRVDLYNMPAFYNDSLKTGSELDLVSQYLDKDHNYRTGKVNYTNRGLIFDGFGGMQEAFASSGWRNFGCFFTPDSVRKQNYIKVEDSTISLWAYACAGGTYNGFGSANNGKTVDLANHDINAVFTLMFGSWFGDWDYKDAFLRAPLASKPYALTCAWSGRPHWYLHHMGLGETIGYAAQLSQNNWTEYIPNLYQNANKQLFIYAVGMKNIHIALMGDPTLRMYMERVPTPKNLVINQIADNKVELNWESPDNGENIEYFIYRAISPLDGGNSISKYTIINSEPLNQNSFIDSTIVNGEVHYRVIAAKLKQTIGSGTFYNPSPVLENSIAITEVNERPDLNFNLRINPNPAYNFVKINLDLSQSGIVELSIFDIKGQLIKNITNSFLNAGTYNYIWDLRDNTDNKIPAGIYFAKITSRKNTKISKIIVMP